MDYKYEKLKICPYCNSENIKILFSSSDRLTNMPGIFYVSKCNNCYFVFQNPRIKEKYIKEFYTDELSYCIPYKKNIVQKTFTKKIKKYINKKVLINHFCYSNLGNKNFIHKVITYPFKRLWKIILTPKLIENGSLLEIGCSSGIRLSKLEEYGWKNIFGIEMYEKTAKFAKSKGYNVECKRIEDANFKGNIFDVIIMSMVLEHLYAPFKALELITRWLKPKGQLIISIPYFEGFEFNVFKEYSYPLQLPTHINFLNKKILKEYLGKLGYKNIKFYFQFCDRDIIASANYKYVSTQKIIYKFIAQNKIFRKLIIKPFVFILSLLGRSSRVSIFAEKK